MFDYLFKKAKEKLNAFLQFVKAKTKSENKAVRLLTKTAVVVTGGLMGFGVGVLGGLFGMYLRFGTIFSGGAFWTCLFKSLGFGISMYLGMAIMGGLILIGGLLLLDYIENKA